MRRWLRRIFLENLGLKLVALALSFVLFLYVQGERKRDTVTGALVKLSFVAPRGKVLTVDPLDKLSVTLRGPRSAVDRALNEGIDPVEIDLEGRSPGVIVFTNELIRVSPGLTVESIQPPQVEVTWDERLGKQVPLVPRVSGAPASGYRLGQVTAQPKHAQVSGPKGTVEALQEVVLAPVSVDGRAQSFEVSVAVKVKQKYLRAVPESALVGVEILAGIVTRRFEAIPVTIRNRPPDLEVHVSPLRAEQVLLEGPAPVLAKLERSEVKLVIDAQEVGDLKPGRYLMPGRIESLPKEVRLLATVPSSFGLEVRRRKSEGRGGNEAP
jgi:YbbR domain-containing protein